MMKTTEHLNEHDWHCIARLLQGSFFGNGLFDGCSFCKNKDCCTGNESVFRKLSNETGVDLSPAVYGYLHKNGFPYKKFLKGANEDAKRHFRNFFTDLD